MKRVLALVAVVAAAVSTAPPAKATTVFRWKPPVIAPVGTNKLSNWYIPGATTLHDGRAMIMGGGTVPDSFPQGGAIPEAAAAIYSYARNQWALVAPMHVARSAPQAVTLRDGRVLVIQLSYWNDPSTNSYEIYDVSSNSWTASKHIQPALPDYAYQGGRLASLGDGRAAVLGSGPNANSFVYNPASDAWTSLVVPWTPDSIVETATALSDGRLLAVVVSPNVSPAAYVFDPLSNSWQLTTPPSFPHAGQLLSAQATLMRSGRVMFLSTSGDPLATSMTIFDPVAATWRDIPQPKMDVNGATIAALPGNGVAAIGGTLTADGTGTAVFDPGAGKWTIQPDSLRAHRYGSVLTVGDGILAVGAGDNDITEALTNLGKIDTTGVQLHLGSLLVTLP